MMAYTGMDVKKDFHGVLNFCNTEKCIISQILKINSEHKVQLINVDRFYVWLGHFGE